MERKTTISAESGRQDLIIRREFDLPLDLLFRAYIDPDVIEQWMGTRVVKHESKRHGSYQFETTDADGAVVFQANGVIHDCVPNTKITRTFEMDNTPFPVQLEFLEFEEITESTSKLTIQIVYKSVEVRDAMLRLPFAQGINMAHNQLQEVVNKLR